MINEKKVKKYCKDPIREIENYSLAVLDKENMWVCHHRNELTETRDSLKEKGMYYQRPASELIFLTRKDHHRIHLDQCIRKKIVPVNKGVFNSEFGKKFYEKYGITRHENYKLYLFEYRTYKKFKKCRWEL